MNCEAEDRLEDLLYKASLGKTVEAFYKELLKAFLYVPHRFQEQPLSNAPQYPNPFLNILGVQDSERVVVPVFTHKIYIADWCGVEFTFENIASHDLFGRIPKEWWIVLNPGREYEKEFSPWEIDLLRAGEASLPELLAESLADSEASSVVIHPVNVDEELPLKNKITTFAKQHDSIEKIYLAREETDLNAAQLVIGLETLKQANSNDFEELCKNLKIEIATLFIGNTPPKIVGAPIVGMLQHLEPIYIKEVKKRFFNGHWCLRRR